MRKIKCKNPNCKYIWAPRVADPKKCPKCQVRLDYGKYKLN